jgi:hypothetical protein
MPKKTRAMAPTVDDDDEISSPLNGITADSDSDSPV